MGILPLKYHIAAVIASSILYYGVMFIDSLKDMYILMPSNTPNKPISAPQEPGIVDHKPDLDTITGK